MTTELAKFLKSASDHCGSQECEIHENYSGRGMYGKTTAGVVVRSVLDLFTDVIHFVKERAEFYPTGQEFGDTIPDLYHTSSLRTDNMGHDTILY